MRRLLRWFRAQFAWRTVRAVYGWRYLENSVTGQRAAITDRSGGHTPIDWHWLRAGKGRPMIDWVELWGGPR